MHRLTRLVADASKRRQEVETARLVRMGEALTHAKSMDELRNLLNHQLPQATDSEDVWAVVRVDGGRPLPEVFPRRPTGWRRESKPGELDATDLLSRVDAALYRAKHDGHDRVCVDGGSANMEHPTESAIIA